VTVKRIVLEGRGYRPVPVPRPSHVSTSALSRTGSTKAWRRIRAVVLKRDRYLCQYCGQPANTVDHRVPRKLGGGDELDNLAACCVRCQSLELRPLASILDAHRGRHRGGGM